MKQPRVPEYREGEGAAKYLKALTLFLKDFCMESWTANRQRTDEISKLKGEIPDVTYPVRSVNKKTGDVVLGAADVGALPSNGKATDSAKLGGKDAKYYTNPKNLLKNSNFADPVNTVGMNAIYNSQRKHVIDCWMLDNDLTATQTTEGIQLISSKNDWWAGMVQRIDRSSFNQGKTYTVAVHGRFENDFRLYIWQEDVADSALAVDYFAACSEWKTHIITFSVQNALPNGDVSFSISPDNPLTGKPTYVKWAALYEGEYTADNVPPPFIYPKRMEMLNLGLSAQPENLLNNSYWALPQRIINSNNFVSGSHLSPWAGFIDCWQEYAGTSAGTFTFDDSGALLEGIAAQHVLNDKFRSGQQYTYAVYFMDGTAICTSGIVTTGNEGWNTYSANSTGDMQVMIFSDTTKKIAVRFDNTGGKRVKGHALYQGAYTIETLPPYLPKGHEVELYACTQGYPIGSIYMSVNSTSPASLFGGSWERLEDRFLLGAGGSYAVGSTGGDQAVTLTIDQIPSHQHAIANDNPGSPNTFSYTKLTSTYGGAKGYDSNMGTAFAGGGGAHNNMPPYLAVYMWKRVS